MSPDAARDTRAAARPETRPLVLELKLLALAALLGVVHVVAAAVATTRRVEGGLAWSAGPRDEPRPPPGGLAGRLTRVRNNFLETFPFFAALLLAAAALGAGGALTLWGASLYLAGRVAYLPCYALGLPVRSLVWAVSMTGLGLVLLAVLTG